MTNATDKLIAATDLNKDEQELLNAIRANKASLVSLMERWVTVTNSNIEDCLDLTDDQMRTVAIINSAFGSLNWTNFDPKTHEKFSTKNGSAV